MFAVDCVSKHELSWTVKLIFTCGWILLFCPDFTLHIWPNTKREESQDTEFEQAVSHKGPVVVWQTLAKMLACTYFLSASTWAGSFRNASMCIFSLCDYVGMVFQKRWHVHIFSLQLCGHGLSKTLACAYFLSVILQALSKMLACAYFLQLHEQALSQIWVAITSIEFHTFILVLE